MGKAKVVNYRNNRYCGDMTEEQCDVLEMIIQADKMNSCFADLRHIITDMDVQDVRDFIFDMDTFNAPMREYPKPVGLLRDEQTLGVAFMYMAKRCILGDSVGIGKTVQTAGVLNLIRKAKGDGMRYLVLTQKTIASQFREELVRFTGHYVQLIPSGEKDVMNIFLETNPYDSQLDYSIVGTHNLLNTASFLQWLELCRTQGYGFPFDTLVIDESSVMGGTGTQIVNSYKAISKYFDNIYFLNATPFDTKLDIFYNQLSLLDGSFLPTKQNFTKEYCIMDYRGMYPRKTGRYKNAEYFKQLVGYRYFARTRRDKGAVMQDCDGRLVLSPLSDVQREWLVKSQMHRMVYDCPTYIDPSIEFNAENVPKLGSLLDLMDNECKDAKTILIFVYYKEAQRYLSEWLTAQGYSNRIINGDTSADDRQSAVNDFKEEKFRILITSVQRGLNFGNCNHVIFYSFDANPSSMLQFEGRVTRSFDIIGKRVYILCSRGKELATLNQTVVQRARATKNFTNTDFSMVLDILLSGGN